MFCSWSDRRDAQDKGCVSDAVNHLYGWLLIILWLPSCVVASIVWPLWMISLQLGTVLANDDVEDLMKKLEPGNVRESYSTPTDPRANERNWQREVALPGAMLVSMMAELSNWGLA